MAVKVNAALVVTLLFSGGCETFYGPTSPSDDWAVFESPRYTLNTRPGSFCASQAGSLAEVLEDQYAHTVNVLQIEPGGRISMFLYNSGTEITPALPSPRSGVAFPETNAAHAVCVAPFDDDLRGLLAHEANHVIIQNGLGRAGTSFMNEGLASAVRSGRFGNIGPAALHAWVRNNPGRVVPLAELIDDAKWNSNSSDRYGSSASFLAFVIERYGAARLKQLYHASSAQLPGRMREVYGTAMEGLETEWRTAVSAR